MGYFKTVYHLKEEDLMRIESMIAAFQIAIGYIFEKRTVNDEDLKFELEDFTEVVSKIRDDYHS